MNAERAPFTLPLPHIELPEARRRVPLRRVVTTEPPPQPTTDPRRRQAWLAVRLMDLPFAAALRALTAEQRSTVTHRPLAVVDDDRFRSVLSCNEHAHRHGVRPGHRLNAAIALCAPLECLPRSLPQETQLLESLALHCQRYTPTVVIEPPNELVLEVRGSLKLFGGIDALMDALAQDLQAAGLTASLAISRTLRSAQWFARHADRRIVMPNQQAKALAELPLRVLKWPPDIQQRLQRFGVNTVGQLVRLPRGGLARRIGHEYLKQLDQAQGREPDLRPSYAPPSSYHDRILLDFEIETLTLAESVLVYRLGRLQRFLTRRNATLSELTISLLHRDLPTTTVPLGLAAPSGDTTHLTRLLHETLNGLQLPAPIREMHIHVPRWFSAAATTSSLRFDPKSQRHCDDLATSQVRLLEQLRARLGADRVRSITAHADRRPAHTQRSHGAHADPSASPAPIPSLPPRPLWLLSEPKAMSSITRGQPRGLIDDPERIQGGWWDGDLTDRDYFAMRSASGAVGWVYRDHLQQDRWFLQGLFA
ncbi:DNA polymerase Y family protein [Povalibacter sp.]|uniref:Y-family DNA polymerase n=1 Tax=Povalibacter sp. TaxID=1962978 RepID=UPI002F3FF0B9